ncbi:hypothetical protein GHT06_007323 [Daphnia sinensis]|uniref:NAD-dependent epimerase/dehydratase domain-containing protein n=1 Tax=Daphnia sinensis TaxID=1820382 RepID=A0AAD5L1F8_9CRUS|nr:hypothetical protein GHT06_007323 [Daphnia sinensis]
MQQFSRCYPRRFFCARCTELKNTDNVDRMKGILEGLAKSPWPVVLPIHPRTRGRLAQMGLSMPDNVHVIDPVGYLEMVWLEMNCQLVITDSGGFRKRLTFMPGPVSPCVTKQSGRSCGVGVNRLVGVNPARIGEALAADWSKILENPDGLDKRVLAEASRGLVAVTGASGFIGKVLLAQLLSAGWKVRVLTRDHKSGHPWRLWMYLQVIWLRPVIGQDSRNTSTRFDDGGECAGSGEAAPCGDGDWCAPMGTAFKCGCVWTKCFGVVDEHTLEKPEGPYEKDQDAFDQLLRAAEKQSHLQVCIVRPSNVYGPGMANQSLFQMMRMIRRGWFAYMGPEGASANYVHVDDVVSALLLCAASPQAAGKTYNVSDWTTIENLVAAMAKNMGVSAPTRRLSLSFMMLLARSLQWLPRWPLTVGRVRALSGRARYSTHRIEQDLGWRASSPWSVGCKTCGQGLRHVCKSQ